MIRPLLPAILLVLLLPGSPALAQGQGQGQGGGRPLRAMGVQDLAFGTILPGVLATVLPTDPLNAGQFEIRGQRLTEVLVDLLLPQALTGPGGAGIPVFFGPGAAGYSPTGAITAQAGFDPGIPQAFTLPGNGRGVIFLGGTASPPAQLAAGSYTAAVTVTLAYLSN